MNYPFPVLAIMMLVIAIMAINRRRSDQKQADVNQTFLERESAANATRKKDISVLEYVKIPVNLLEPTNPEFSNLCLSELNEIRRLSSERLLNLTIYSNTDLKLMYGPQNLDDLSMYDTNFTNLELAITALTRKCIDAGLTSEAVPYLKFAIEYKTTNSQIYTMLGDIYSKQGETEKIQALIDGLSDQNFLMKKTIVEKLSQMV